MMSKAAKKVAEEVKKFAEVHCKGTLRTVNINFNHGLTEKEQKQVKRYFNGTYRVVFNNHNSITIIDERIVMVKTSKGVRLVPTGGKDRNPSNKELRQLEKVR